MKRFLVNLLVNLAGATITVAIIEFVLPTHSETAAYLIYLTGLLAGALSLFFMLMVKDR